jgi:hypothetical protein
MSPPDELARFLASAQVTVGMDDLRRRLAEIEERLDFAERLLTESPPANQLPRGAER